MMYVEGAGDLSHGLSGITTGQCFTTLVVCELRLAPEPDPSGIEVQGNNESDRYGRGLATLLVGGSSQRA